MRKNIYFRHYKRLTLSFSKLYCRIWGHLFKSLLLSHKICSGIYLQANESLDFICSLILAANIWNTYVICMYLISSYFTLQYMFVLLVLPCLVLAYLGQAAFLIANQKSSEQVFFSSIPSKLDVVEHLAYLPFLMDIFQ